MRKILLVDDDKFFQRDLKTMVFPCMFATDEMKKALEIVEKESVDLVLLDLDLKKPGKDGIEILNAIRKNHRREDLPILILTRYPDMVNTPTIAVLANGVIGKPVNARKLKSAAERVINNKLVFCNNTPKGFAQDIDVLLRTES